MNKLLKKYQITVVLIFFICMAFQLNMYTLIKTTVLDLQGKIPHAAEGGLVAEMADWLIENTEPGDFVQQLDWIGGVQNAMLRARLRVATRYLVDYQFYHDVDHPFTINARKEFVDSLKEKKPRFLIQRDRPRPTGKGTSYLFPALTDFMNRYYRLAKAGNTYRIYEYKGDEKATPAASIPSAPPDQPVTQQSRLAPDQIESITCSATKACNLSTTLTDLNINTPRPLWQPAYFQGEATAETLEIHLKAPALISGLILMGSAGDTIKPLQISSLQNGKETVLFTDPAATDQTAPVAGAGEALLGIWKNRFPPVVSDQLRLEIWAEKDGTPLITELLLLTENKTEPSTPSPFAQLPHEAHAIYATAEAKKIIQVNFPKGFEKMTQPPAIDNHYPENIRNTLRPLMLNTGIWVVVENSEAPFTSRCLQENNIPFKNTPYGALTIFTFDQQHDKISLYWTEEGCFSGVTLPSTEEEVGSPRIPVSAIYGKNITLLGVDWPQRTYHAGEQVEVNYYWHCPPADISDKAVLVHIDHDAYRIQDDHIFLSAFDPLHFFAQDGTKTFKETRTITIPSNAPPGEYKMKIGVYDRNTGIRTDVKTTARCKKNKVIIPEPLIVQ